MTADEALERWNNAHNVLTAKEIAMHRARVEVSLGQMRVEALEALQDEVVQLRAHSDQMLALALEMLRLEKEHRAGKPRGEN